MKAYIIKGYRTAVGKAPRGLFRFMRPDDLAAATIKHLVHSIPNLDVNRIDDVIVFNALEREDIHSIIDIELDKLLHRILDLGYTLKLSDKAKDYIADKGFDKKYGARPLKRAIQKYIEDALAEEIVNSKLTEGDTITMDLDEQKNNLTIKIKKGKKAKEKKTEAKD